MVRCYIALGSNLGDSADTFVEALAILDQHPKINLRAVSPNFRSKPLGDEHQPDYLNTAAAIDTDLSPEVLLDELLRIETLFGRVRDPDNRWGPRTLDLDIILYGNDTVQTQRLTIPHNGLKERVFVLKPLLKLNPDLVFPDGTTARESYQRLAEADKISCFEA